MPLLNLLFHSSEAIVGGSPYNRTQRRARRLPRSPRSLPRLRHARAEGRAADVPRVPRSLPRRHADVALVRRTARRSASAWFTSYFVLPTSDFRLRLPTFDSDSSDAPCASSTSRRTCRPIRPPMRCCRRISDAGRARPATRSTYVAHPPRAGEAEPSRRDRWCGFRRSGATASRGGCGSRRSRRRGASRARRAAARSRRRRAPAQQRPAGRGRARGWPRAAGRRVVLTLYGTEIWHYRPKPAARSVHARCTARAAHVTFYSRGLHDKALELGLARDRAVGRLSAGGRALRAAGRRRARGAAAAARADAARTCSST